MRIVDDAAPIEEFSEVCNYISSMSFPWYYGRLITPEQGEVNPYELGWVHPVFNGTDWISAYSTAINHCVLTALEDANEQVHEILRIRVIMNTIAPEPFVLAPHIDTDVPHKTCILYLTECDGDTIFYKERFQGQFATEFTEESRVTPKANRMILFDGLQYHSGSTPTKNAARIAINFNYR